MTNAAAFYADPAETAHLLQFEPLLQSIAGDRALQAAVLWRDSRRRRQEAALWLQLDAQHWPVAHATSGRQQSLIVLQAGTQRPRRGLNVRGLPCLAELP